MVLLSDLRTVCPYEILIACDPMSLCALVQTCSSWFSLCEETHFKKLIIKVYLRQFKLTTPALDKYDLAFFHKLLGDYSSLKSLWRPKAVVDEGVDTNSTEGTIAKSDPVKVQVRFRGRMRASGKEEEFDEEEKPSKVSILLIPSHILM
jgi:hypothetical protein